MKKSKREDEEKANRAEGWRRKVEKVPKEERGRWKKGRQEARKGSEGGWFRRQEDKGIS